MTGSRESSQVLIVGAGPAGAALAHLLATRGARVCLLERQSDFAREFRGEVLMPSGVDALQSLGLGAAMDGVPKVVPSSMSLYVNRKCALEVDARGMDLPEDASPVVYSQPGLLEAIVGDAQQRSSLDFRRGASVKELLRENGRIVGVRARTEHGEEQLFADLVVGCDGRASVVRRFAPFEVASQELPMDVVWCKVPRPKEYEGSYPASFCIGKGHLFVSYVTHDGSLQVAWIILKGSYGELKRRGVEDWVGELADYAPPELSDHLRANAANFEHPFLLDTRADRVARWSLPGALVLGDAAHTMSPVGGQGVNIALRDAVVAANHLVPRLREGAGAAELDQAAQRIEAERLPEVELIQRMQALPPKVMLRDAWWAELLRQLPRLLRFAPVQRLAAGNASPFFFGATDVTLRV